MVAKQRHQQPAAQLPRSVEELCAWEREGRALKYLYFWGHRPGRDGGIGAGCFSQWWPAAFTVDGVDFRTAEHYMMHGKALLFGDEEAAAAIVEARTPAEAKKLGRQVRGFVEETWTARRFDIVVAGSVAKFGQHPGLRDYLLDTGDQVLVEASPTDRIWGIGLAAADERAASPASWRGLNLLGFALMRARETLRAERGA